MLNSLPLQRLNLLGQGGVGRIAHLRGLIRAGTATSGTVAFTLPEGFRPTTRRLFSCTTGGAGPGDQGDHARCDVLSDGRVMLYNVSNEWVSLDGMSFTTW